MIFFRIPRPYLSLWIDLNNVFHRRKSTVGKGASWCWGAEPGTVLFLCLFALSHSPCAYSSPGAFIFFWEKTQEAQLFSVSVWNLLHTSELFLSARCRLLRKESEGASKQHESGNWRGKVEIPLPGYQLAVTNHTRDGSQRNICTDWWNPDSSGSTRAGVKSSDGTKGNSRFGRAEKLKPARCQMALYPLTGSWQLLLGAPGPGKKRWSTKRKNNDKPFSY